MMGLGKGKSLLNIAIFGFPIRSISGVKIPHQIFPAFLPPGWPRRSKIDDGPFRWGSPTDLVRVKGGEAPKTRESKT